METFVRYKLFSIVIATFIIQISLSSRLAAQDAHTNLDNLTPPTKIPQSLLPATDSALNLGSANKAWKNIYNKGSIYYGAQRSVFFKNTNTAIGLNAMITSASGTYNTAAGYQSLYFNTGTGNTAAGAQSLYSNTSGNYNNASGTYAMYINTTGSENTALGFSSLKLNTTGSYNTAAGKDALYSNTTGSENTAFGHGCMFNNTTGYYNAALGRNALHENTTGQYNTATGYEALYFNTTGGSNTANGYGALYSNTTASHNNAAGFQALFSNTTGSENNATGYQALYTNTNGYSNTADGYHALFTNTIGTDNTATGSVALSHNTTGKYNTSVGDGALALSTTGSYNTSVGASALLTNTTGSFNTAIGYEADVADPNIISNATAIGAYAVVAQSNSIVLGGTGNYAVNVGIGTTSPQYSLSVNGTIQAKEVKVQTGWSDFVFNKNYKLRSLNKVEKYINQNHHLPEIPSAADIQKNGLAVADVQAKMMQKIEELTLYIIQLQKQIDQLKSKNNEHK